jgi:hypothetical protein
MPKAVAKSTTKLTTRTRSTEIRATYASAYFTGYHCNVDRPYQFNVAAGANGVCLYGGTAEMSRDQAVQTAIDMLTAAVALDGLTTAERSKLREIAAAECMFPPDVAAG